MEKHSQGESLAPGFSHVALHVVTLLHRSPTAGGQQVLSILLSSSEIQNENVLRVDGQESPEAREIRRLSCPGSGSTSRSPQSSRKRPRPAFDKGQEPAMQRLEGLHGDVLCGSLDDAALSSARLPAISSPDRPAASGAGSNAATTPPHPHAASCSGSSSTAQPVQIAHAQPVAGHPDFEGDFLQALAGLDVDDIAARARPARGATAPIPPSAIKQRFAAALGSEALLGPLTPPDLCSRCVVLHQETAVLVHDQQPCQLLWVLAKPSPAFEDYALHAPACPAGTCVFGISCSGQWAEEEVAAVGSVAHVVACCSHGTPPKSLCESGVQVLAGSGDVFRVLSVSNERNALVLHPDIVLSPTRVLTACGCVRKACIGEVAAPSTSSKAMFLGTLKHELFENLLEAACSLKQDGVPGHAAVPHLAAISREVARRLVHARGIPDQLIAAHCTLESALKSLLLCAQSIIPFLQTHVFGVGGRASWAVKRIVGVEDGHWSPVWGLKGVLDVVAWVDLFQHPPASPSMLPLEIKTGRLPEAPKVEHQAQVLLYALLLSTLSCTHLSAKQAKACIAVGCEAGPQLNSQGQHGPLAGLLIYLSEGMGAKTFPIWCNWQEIAALLRSRNRLACALKRWHESSLGSRPVLPRPLSASSECDRCFMRRQCDIIHDIERPASDADRRPVAYARRWWQLVSREAAEATLRAQTSVVDREYLVTPATAQGFWLDAPTAELAFGGFHNGAQSSRQSIGDKPQLTTPEENVLTLKLPKHGQLAFCEGDHVILSICQGPVAVARGVVRRSTATCVQVACVQNLQRCSVVASPLYEAASPNSVVAFYRRVTRLKWRLDADVFTTTTKASLQALLQVASPADDRPVTVSSAGRHAEHDGQQAISRTIREIICGAAVPEHSDPFPVIDALQAMGAPSCICESFKQLNEEQQGAVQFALGAKQLAIIQGMPGAGKSTTIVTLVRILVALGNKVLLTSFTHSAVDNVLLKLLEHEDTASLGVLARSGRLTSIHPAVRSCSVQCIQVDRPGSSPLAQARVVGSSCLGLKDPALAHQHFDVVIVDEASQLTEPLCVKACLAARVAVLVGDHLQLSPLVQHSESADLGLGTSMMERLAGQFPGCVRQLTQQFRMSAPIQAVGNAIMYSGSMRCATEATAQQRLCLPRHLHSDLHSVPWARAVTAPDPAVLLLSPSREEEMPPPTPHHHAPACAMLVASTVAALLSAGLKPGHLAILTAFNLHCKAYSRLLQGWAQAVEVSTIDRFQGRDKPVVVLDLSSSSLMHAALLQDPRRLNVATTRARSKLVIVAQAESLYSTPLAPVLVEERPIVPTVHAEWHFAPTGPTEALMEATAGDFVLSALQQAALASACAYSSPPEHEQTSRPAKVPRRRDSCE